MKVRQFKATSSAGLRRILEAAENKARRAFVDGDAKAYRAAIRTCQRARAELRNRTGNPPLTD